MSSPVIRRYPHRGLSWDQVANLTADPRASGTPSWKLPAACDEPAVPCQQRVGSHEERLPAPRGSSRLAKAKNARSVARSADREACRRRSAISWRRTTISGSLYSDERSKSNTSFIRRLNSTYSKDTNTNPPPIDQASETTASGAQNARTSRPDRVYAPHRPRSSAETRPEVVCPGHDARARRARLGARASESASRSGSSADSVALLSISTPSTSPIVRSRPSASRRGR